MSAAEALAARVEAPAPVKQEEKGGGAALMERIKGTLGLGTGTQGATEERAVESAGTARTTVPPREEPPQLRMGGEEQAEPAAGWAQTAGVGEPGSGGTEPLAAPVTPAATSQLPPRAALPTVSTAAPAAPIFAAAGTTVSPTTAGALVSPSAAVSPVEAATARLEQLGARRGRIGEVEADTGGSSAATATGEQAPEVGAAPEPRQGERVQVERLPLGPAAAAMGGMPKLEVRPEHETRPMSSAEVAGMKAQEHVIQAEEREQVEHAKHRELHQLRGQAELLEVQSLGLLAQASQEKLKPDQMVRRQGQFEQVEWHNYAEAERAEKQRRSVVDTARPMAVAAEESELEAMRLRQLAADTQYHGEVLERKARALVQESQDMVALAVQRQADAQQLAAQLLVKRQEQEEWQQKVDMVSSGALPLYIEECQTENGRHARRMAELREEIDWARLEMDRLQAEGITWERVLSTKRSEAGLLRLRMQQAREESEAAQLRSHQAAAEALEPTSLAEAKYEEAYHLAEQAAELEEQAQAAQAEVLQVVQQAVGPEQTRQERLREAADAESRAKQLALQAQLVEGKMERRLVEAETAMVVTQQAERVKEEHRAAKMTAEAQREMAEMYSESEQRHAEAGGMMDKVGVLPSSPEARELMRRQRERYGTPGWEVVPTVPVDMPVMPVPVTPYSNATQVEAMLAEAPTPPAIPAAPMTTTAASVEQAEGAGRMPLAA